jgi:hypothetical protein
MEEDMIQRPRHGNCLSPAPHSHNLGIRRVYFAVEVISITAWRICIQGRRAGPLPRSQCRRVGGAAPASWCAGRPVQQGQSGLSRIAGPPGAARTAWWCIIHKEHKTCQVTFQARWYLSVFVGSSVESFWKCNREELPGRWWRRTILGEFL